MDTPADKTKVYIYVAGGLLTAGVIFLAVRKIGKKLHPHREETKSTIKDFQDKYADAKKQSDKTLADKGIKPTFNFGKAQEYADRLYANLDGHTFPSNASDALDILKQVQNSADYFNLLYAFAKRPLHLWTTGFDITQLDAGGNGNLWDFIMKVNIEPEALSPNFMNNVLADWTSKGIRANPKDAINIK